MRLLLIRHGQTPHNVEGALDTAFPGAGLTALGTAQARALPSALADHKVAAVYASPLVRTQLTAAPLAEDLGLEVVVREGLEEISAGEFEMRSDKEAVRGYVECVERWMGGDLDERMPGGESGQEFLGRYDAAIRRIAGGHDSDDTIVVVSHGAAIRVYVALAARLERGDWSDLRLMNTGMGVLEGHPARGWRLSRWESEPLGGLELEDHSARDVTGESVDEVEEEVD